MSRASKIIPLAAVLLLALSALPAPTAHVALANGVTEVWVAPPPLGNDGNPGTQAQPFATIQKGIDTVIDYGTVHVAAGTYIEPVGIGKSVTLDGAGAQSTIIDGGGISTYKTVIQSTTNVEIDITIQGFTIQNGYQDAVGGIFIQSWNTVYINDCTVRDNVGSSAGGILNLGTLIMNQCTVSGNSGSDGGGIQNRGTLYLCNCTISGNTATLGGGGIYNDMGDNITSEYSTITSNQATAVWSQGGGFHNVGPFTFKDTIVANNTAGDSSTNNGYNVTAQGGQTISLGYNLDSENSCGFNQPTDMVNTNPLLGPLQGNGGPTFTHALLEGSPAIDASTCTGAPATDQRGVTRPQRLNCDIGAFELGGTGAGAAIPTTGPGSSPSTQTPPRPLNPSQLSAQYLSVSPQQTYANQPVTITTNVVNTGDEAGNLNITLKINGLIEQSRMVSVGPQGTQPVKFTITKAQPGTYTVDILGEQGSFTVLGTSGTPVNSGLIALLIMGVLVLATVLVLILSRKPA